MDINSDEEPSSLFKLFTPQTESTVNGNINKETENAKDSPSSQLNNNNDFDDWSQLPDGLKNCVSTELIGRPLNDPFYGNKETFIVVNKNKQLFRYSSTNALKIFSPTSSVRSNAIRILTHPFYAIFMVIVILAFCLVNAFDETTIFDLRYFLVIFLLETLLKIVSQGLLLSPFSYLRNGWNILDVVLNILLLCGIFYLAELRVLKIISYSLNLRKTIRLYWSSCKLLRDLIIYMGLMLGVLSTFFVNVYMGTLSQSCIKDDIVLELNDEIRLCGNSTGAQTCPDSYSCRHENNPDFGYTNFDSIFWSFLSTFRLITRDYWESLLHDVLATSGPWHILSFIGIVFIISYQVLSLIWGQIAISYNYIRLQRWEQSLIAEDVDLDDTTSQETKNDKDGGSQSKFQRFFFFIIYDPFVVLFVIICIILNTLCMALDHHDMARNMDTFLRCANYFFVLIFVIEAILKLLALGVVRYFKDKWNTFDFIVTVLGAVELFLEGVQGLSVFRSFRLLRPLRLGRNVPAFDLLLTRMQHIFSAVSGQTIIFFMAIYIFVVFGCHQFGPDFKNFKFDVEEGIGLPMWRFTDNMHSFMVVFRALCGEWIETLWLCLLVSSNQTVCFIYYLLLVTVSSFQVMHIFTALLFTNDDSTAIKSNNKRQILPKSAEPKEKFQLTQFLKDKLHEPTIKQIYYEHRPKKDIEWISENPSTKTVTKAVIEDDFEKAINKTTDTFITVEPLTTNPQDIAVKNKKNKYFQHYAVTLCILLACIALAVEFDTRSDTYRAFNVIFIYVEFVFIGLLSFELLTKLNSSGWKLCVTDASYWVDLFNIIVAICAIFNQSTVLEVLICIRPLSLVSRFRGLNVIAKAILKQMWFLTNTLLVCMAFWLIFAIMGVQLFAGKFYSCVDANGVRVESVHNITECKEKDYIWEKSYMDFNDVINSYYSLLEVGTFKGWIAVIGDAVDSNAVNETPITEGNIYVFFYFVIFIACGVFVCVNVIVGMLVQHMLRFGSLSELYVQTKTESEDSVETTDKDETSNANLSSFKFINFVRSHAFEAIAFASYIVYVVVLMGDHYYSTAQFQQILIHYVLSILLIVEIFLRGCAYRKEFFTNFWNRFDVVIVVFLIIDCVNAEIAEKYFVSTFLLRMIRIFRFNALIASRSTTLQRCGKILTRTWKPVSMLYLFLFLIICVYALIGGVLYRNTKIEFGSVNIINFETFGHSLSLMIQISTGAGWDGLLEQIAVPDQGISAALFMLSFLYISFTILLNVMIVIAFEFYKEVTSIEDSRKQLLPDDLNDFNEKFKRFAQNDQKYVPKNRLKDFFNSLDETSSLRPAEFDQNELTLLGVNTRKDDNYSRSTLLIALNRIRLNKEQ